ncbi:MAG: hypothetical protein QJR05_05925 [Thermoanaerobacterium sp.]|nr:hypothetical protein [Thermoanaerobacterium sp.]
MTPDEIIKCCERQLELGNNNVFFVMRGRWGKTDTRRLWKGGPKGKIVAEFINGLYVMFDAKEVLEAVKRQKLKVGVRDGRID